MISFLCHWYGLTLEGCLKLYIRTFFALYSQAVKMEARQYRELLDIQVTSIMHLDYYNALRERYQTMIFPERKNLPPPAPGPALQAGSEDAKNILSELMAKVKHGMGIGNG